MRRDSQGTNTFEQVAALNISQGEFVQISEASAGELLPLGYIQCSYLFKSICSLAIAPHLTLLYAAKSLEACTLWELNPRLAD